MRFSSSLFRQVAVAWVVIVTLLLVLNANSVAHRQFPDPDDVLRLIQVRNLLAGQSWFDLHQYRINPLDGGVLMHWSRLEDIPIAAVILLFRPLLGPAGAEMIALIIVPMLTLLCLLLLVGWLVKQRLGCGSVMLACFLTATATQILKQFLILRIDHHGWQIVAAMAGLCGLMAQDRRKGGWVAGVAMALSVTISLEGLPLTLAFASIGLWRWLRGEGPVWLPRFLAGLAITSTLAFLATRGLADLAEHCDEISPVHLVVFTLAAMAFTLLSRWPHLPIRWMLASAALVGGLLFIPILIMAPQCTGGAFVDVDPVVRSMWLANVGEGLPIWRQGWMEIFTILIPGLAGCVIACRQAIQASGPEKPCPEKLYQEKLWWWDYAAALATALTVACLVERAAGTSCAFAILPLTGQIERWLHTMRQGQRPVQRMSAFASIAMLLPPVLPITLTSTATTMAQLLAAKSRTKTAVQLFEQSPSKCSIDENAARLRGLGKANFLAPIDIGPQLLLDAPRATVLATGHHRNSVAIREVIDSFTGRDAATHAIITRRHIDYIALCPHLGEVGNYLHAGPQGLAAHLLAGSPPSWLRPLGPAAGESLRLWQVIH